MVAIALPPPKEIPQPVFFEVAPETVLLRIYNPTRYDATAGAFRYFGPVSRFDHHRDSGSPSDDPERGIIYAGLTLRACLVEIFGDTKIVQLAEYEIARLTVTRNLRLLDLRQGNAMKAGTVAGVCKDSNRQYSQSWARFFYEMICFYQQIDGLVWGNAHNDDDAFALFERAEDAIVCGADDSCPLNDDALRDEILLCALETGMVVEAY